MRIGVVIPTIGRKDLAACLKALVGQPYDEIVVVRDYYAAVAKARNRGIGSMDVDIVACLDDDCVPDPNWVAEGRRFFEENLTIGLMQGAIYGGEHSSERFTFLGGNLWFRKSCWELVGGFHEGYLVAGHEETDFCWQLLDAGIDYKYNANCRVQHPTKFWHKRFAAADELLARRHPKRFRKLITEDVVV